jgi:hypothetical protein
MVSNRIAFNKNCNGPEENKQVRKVKKSISKKLVLKESYGSRKSREPYRDLHLYGSRL